VGKTSTVENEMKKNGQVKENVYNRGKWQKMVEIYYYTKSG